VNISSARAGWSRGRFKAAQSINDVASRLRLGSHPVFKGIVFGDPAPIQLPEITIANQSLLKTGLRNANQVDVFSEVVSAVFPMGAVELKCLG